MPHPQSNKQSTVEISNVAPALRSDLKFSLQQHGGETCYLIEDEKNTKFYRVGIPEYTFISLLDGTTTVREAIAYTASKLGKEAFSERDAASICKWLIDSQLAFTDASSDYQRLLQGAETIAKSKRVQRFNPLLLRLPLVRPDGIVTSATKLFGWWFSKPAFFIWLAVVVYAIYEVATKWSAVDPAALRILAPGNLARLLVSWTLLKIVHEFSHGIACKKYGGHVREAGLLFIVLAPIPYVDVTSSWRMASKWKRIVVSAAGMYTELFFGAIAAIICVNAEPGVVQQMAYNFLITASVVTLIFNANPLMRFDGYYILSDYWEIPNLYALGQQFTRYLGRKYALGVPARLPNWGWRRGLAIRGYGICAFFWRLFICASLILAASTILEGAGIVLAIGAGILWIGIPLVKFVGYLFQGNTIEKPSLRRFAIASVVVGCALGGLLMLPEPGGVRAPAVVQYEPLHIIRAPHSGFVTQVFLRAGSAVAAGQPIVQLDNPELQTEVAQMRIQGKQSEHRSRIYSKDEEVAALQVEREMRDVLKRQIKERDQQLSMSTVTSPAAGTIISREMQTLLGRYVQEGEELCAVGANDQKELQVSVAQLDLPKFSEQSGNDVEVKLHTPGSSPLSCVLGAVDPRADQRLPHDALAAANGGPLVVQPIEAADESLKWQLIEPRFNAQVPLDSEMSAGLRAGQLTTVRLQVARGTMASFFYRGMTGWIDRRLSVLR